MLERHYVCLVHVNFNEIYFYTYVDAYVSLLYNLYSPAAESSCIISVPRFCNLYVLLLQFLCLAVYSNLYSLAVVISQSLFPITAEGGESR